MKPPVRTIETLIAVCLTCCVAFAQDTGIARIELTYGGHDRQRMDLYPAPHADPDHLSPAVIYFHGGGFNHGDKSQVSENLIKRMHDKGISVVAANYRFIKTDPLPAAMQDGVRVVQYLRHVSTEYHLDPERIAVLGTSAGAGISLWIALHDDLADPDADDPVARESTRVVCVYGKNAQVSYDPRFWRRIGLERVFEHRTFHELYGLADDAPETPELIARFDEASPITYLSADDPPIRLDYTYGTALDDSTPMSALIHHPAHGLALKEACGTLGVSCVLTYPDGPTAEESGYGFLIRQLSQ